MPVSRGQELVERLSANQSAAFAGNEIVSVEKLDGTKLIFGDESWLLFRQSGTEPMLRIYAEATSREKMHALLDAGEEVTRR